MLERSPGWALDASPLINLVASGAFDHILKCTDRRFVAVSKAANEVSRTNGTSNPLERFFQAGLLTRAELSERAFAVFAQLVGDDDDLGDGEAATIAHALEEKLGVVLDDGKARRICSTRYPAIPMLSTVELFRHPMIVESLGPRLGLAVFDALSIGRMRVLIDHDEWVRSLIGEERAARCPSLRRRPPGS